MSSTTRSHKRRLLARFNVARVPSILLLEAVVMQGTSMTDDKQPNSLRKTHPTSLSWQDAQDNLMKITNYHPVFKDPKPTPQKINMVEKET